MSFDDINRAVAAIEDAAGQKVLGYRAPSFSIVPKSLWAVDILAQEGFCTVSVFPIRHDLYGMPDAPRFPFRWRCGHGRRFSKFSHNGSRHELQPARGGGRHLRILPMVYTRGRFENSTAGRQGNRLLPSLGNRSWTASPGRRGNPCFVTIST
jgi:hypothetical protein